MASKEPRKSLKTWYNYGMDRLSASRDIEALLVDNGGICFKAEVFNQICGPIVYLFLKDGAVV